MKINAKYKTFLKVFFGLLLIVLAFFWIFRKIDIDLLWSELFKMAWWTLPVLIACNLIIMSLQGVRWWLLIRAFAKKFSFLQAMSFHFSSIFYSIALPNSTAQEVLRTLLVQKEAGSIVSWSSAWICKITGVFVSVAFSLIGLLLVQNDVLPKYAYVLIIALLLIIVLLSGFSMSKKFSRPLRKVIKKIIPDKYFTWLEHLREGIYQFRNKKKTIITVVGITILNQIVFVVSVYFIIKGITNSGFFIECLAYIPLIETISMAQPFTPNGIGVRDVLVALMFEHIGISKEQTATYIIVILSSHLLKLVGLIPVIIELIKKIYTKRVLSKGVS